MRFIRQHCPLWRPCFHSRFFHIRAEWQVREKTSGGKYEWSSPSESHSKQLSSSWLQSEMGGGGCLCAHHGATSAWNFIAMQGSSLLLYMFSSIVYNNCVVLKVIFSVDDGNAVVMAAGSGVEELMRRKTVWRADPCCGEPYHHWSSWARVEHSASGVGQTTQGFVWHISSNYVIEFSKCRHSPYIILLCKLELRNPCHGLSLIHCW